MPKLKLSHESDPEHIPDVVVSPLELKPKRVLYGLIVGAVIITIGVTGAFFLTDYFNPKATPIPPIEIKKATDSAKVSTKSATPFTKQDETADWKTYKNSKLGFQFKYPSSEEDQYYISKESDSKVVLGLKNAAVSEPLIISTDSTTFVKLNAYKHCSEYEAPEGNIWPYPPCISDEGSTTIDRKNAIIFTLFKGTDNDYRIIQTKTEPLIEFYSPYIAFGPAKKIIDTFKFLN